MGGMGGFGQPAPPMGGPPSFGSPRKNSFGQNQGMGMGAPAAGGFGMGGAPAAGGFGMGGAPAAGGFGGFAGF